MTTLGRHLKTVAALAVLSCAVGAAHAKGYMTAGFQAKRSRPMTLAILPPHAEVIKEKVVMTDDMPQEAAALEREAALALKAGLAAKGYNVRLITPDDLKANPATRTLVKKVQDRYNEEWRKIVYRPKQVRERRYQGGDDVLRLCAMLKVQGLAVSRIQAVGVSKGKATMRYFSSSSQPHSYARVDMGILEGQKGYVEAYFSGYENTSLGQILKKPALVMGQAAEHALKKYPAAADVRQVEEAVAQKDADDAADESAIKDFEVLMSGSKAKTGGN